MASAPSDVRAPKPAVFLQEFVDVARPPDVIGEKLATGSQWLGHLASAAGGDTETLLVRIGPGSAGRAPAEWIAREVRVRIGRSTETSVGVRVPLRWEDARRPGLFPVLDGNLEVASLGPNRSRIVLYASYRPPFDSWGHALDHALLHRVAESTIRSFLGYVAARLEDPSDGVGEQAAAADAGAGAGTGAGAADAVVTGPGEWAGL